MPENIRFVEYELAADEGVLFLVPHPDDPELDTAFYMTLDPRCGHLCISELPRARENLNEFITGLAKLPQVAAFLRTGSERSPVLFEISATTAVDLLSSPLIGTSLTIRDVVAPWQTERSGLPRFWELFGYILPKRHRLRVFTPSYNDLLDDYLHTRQYRTPMSRRWLAVCFTFHTANLNDLA